MISAVERIAPIYKTGLRKKPYQTIYLPNRKSKKMFKDLLEKEIEKEVGFHVSVKV